MKNTGGEFAPFLRNPTAPQSLLCNVLLWDFHRKTHTKKTKSSWYLRNNIKPKKRAYVSRTSSLNAISHSIDLATLADQIQSFRIQ